MSNDFYEQIYEVVRQIPKGRVTSYGAIAKYLGAARSSRVVGWAMNNCHTQQPPVPAHRVVNRNGLLTGRHHFGTSTIMQQLLENEGIEVVDNQVQNFKEVFWNPSEHLKTLF